MKKTTVTCDACGAEGAGFEIETANLIGGTNLRVSVNVRNPYVLRHESVPDICLDCAKKALVKLVACWSPDEAVAGHEARNDVLAVFGVRDLPAGYAVVPVEPTDAMKLAGSAAAVNARGVNSTEDACAVYKAMVRVARG